MNIFKTNKTNFIFLFSVIFCSSSEIYSAQKSTEIEPIILGGSRSVELISGCWDVSEEFDPVACFLHMKEITPLEIEAITLLKIESMSSSQFITAFGGIVQQLISAFQVEHDNALKGATQSDIQKLYNIMDQPMNEIVSEKLTGEEIEADDLPLDRKMVLRSVVLEGWNERLDYLFEFLQELYPGEMHDNLKNL